MILLADEILMPVRHSRDGFYAVYGREPQLGTPPLLVRSIFAYQLLRAHMRTAAPCFYAQYAFAPSATYCSIMHLHTHTQRPLTSCVFYYRRKRTAPQIIPATFTLLCKFTPYGLRLPLGNGLRRQTRPFKHATASATSPHARHRW